MTADGDRMAVEIASRLGDARGFDPAIGERCVAELADLTADHFR